MSPIIFNDPLNIHWQTNLYDALTLTIFVSAAVYATMQFRRGRRIYAVLLFAALIFGQVLELAGMATLNMYVQGDFALMLNYPALSLFEGTTAMPFYVTIFYPMMFFLGFKVVEALGMASSATSGCRINGIASRVASTMNFSKPGAKKEITLHCIPNAGRSGCQLNGTASLAKSNRTRRIGRSVIGVDPFLLPRAARDRRYPSNRRKTIRWQLVVWSCDGCPRLTRSSGSRGDYELRR